MTTRTDNSFSTLRNFYTKKKIFLSGHTGFKGSWFLMLLKELGADVKGYALEAEQPSLYQDIKGDELCNSIIADIRDTDKLQSAIEDYQPDFIFHFAAQPLVLDGYEDPIYTFDVNAMGTAHILEAAKAVKKACSIVVITTDKVYDNKEWIYPYREVDALGGHDPYSASKACAELIVASYRNSFFHPTHYQKHQTGLASARAGNVIGGGDWAANRLIPDIARSIQKGEELVLRNPAAVRPWQHVLEALTGYLWLGLHLSKTPALHSQAYNFGPATHEALTVENLVEIALRVWNKGSFRVEQTAEQQHEAKLLRLDSSKVIDVLDWKPKWSAEAAIEHTIDWYKQVLHEGISAKAITTQQIQNYFSVNG